MKKKTILGSCVHRTQTIKKRSLKKIQGFNGILFGGLDQSFSLRDANKQVPKDSRNMKINVSISYE